MNIWPTMMISLGLSALGTAMAAPSGDDPARSAIWPELRDEYLSSGPVVFDDAVRIMMPGTVENAFDVPVVIKFPSDLGQLREFVLIVEDNPIQVVTRVYPHRPIESIGFSIRMEMSTSVRAAALAEDGTWYVGSKQVVVLSPGGCSSPNPNAGDIEIGAIATKQFERVGGASRTKVKILHPMDTGFAPSEDGELVPAYFIDRIEITDESGPVLEMITWAAMASDPTIIIDLPDSKQSLRVWATDSKGLVFDSLGAPASM